MMSAAVMPATVAENASYVKSGLEILSNAPSLTLRHNGRVLGTQEILTELERREVPKADIAKVLGVDPSQVTRLFATEGKPRHLKHDEAVKLVEAFGLEQGPDLPPLPPAVWRLVAHHIAEELELPLKGNDPRLPSLTADLAAFSRFLRSRPGQGLVEAAEHFFEAMRLRSEIELEEPRKNHPQLSR